MRFIFFSTETRPVVGGIARALDGWLTGLTMAGHEVCVLSMLSEGWSSKIQGLTERPYREEWLWLPDRIENVWDQLIMTGKLRSALYLVRQRRLIEQRTAQVLTKFKPDVGVFAVLNPVNCLPLNQVIGNGVHCAAIAYGSEIQPKRVTNPKWLRKTLTRMDRLIVISEYTRQLLIKWTGQTAKISVVHPALSPDVKANPAQEIEMSGNEPTAQLASDEVRLLTICRLVERKGIQTVLQAIHALRREVPNLRYDIVGDGPFRTELEFLMVQLGITDQVRFHGGLSDKKRDELLYNCNLFVMTPFEASDGDVEGFGIVFLEAGMHGKPVIASGSGGVADAVHHQKTGWVVPAGDVNCLAIVIRHLTLDAALYQQLGMAGRIWAQKHTPINIGRVLARALLEY